MEVTMKNAVFWDVMPRGSCKNRRFGGAYRLNHQVGKDQRDTATLAGTSNGGRSSSTGQDMGLVVN
jgi:hypothetical protein